MNEDEIDQLREQAAEKLERVYEQHQWVVPIKLLKEAMGIARENAKRSTRTRKLFALADRVNEALKPVALCKVGCSHCCSMTTMLYRHEALEIARFSGRRMHEVGLRPYDIAHRIADRYFGKPCVFLKDDRCSVYEARPLVCRLHHSLNEDLAACDSAVPLRDRQPLVRHDIDAVEVPYHLFVRSFRPEPWGSIHEFFPY